MLALHPTRSDVSLRSTVYYNTVYTQHCAHFTTVDSPVSRVERVACRARASAFPRAHRASRIARRRPHLGNCANRHRVKNSRAYINANSCTMYSVPGGAVRVWEGEVHHLTIAETISGNGKLLARFTI